VRWTSLLLCAATVLACTKNVVPVQVLPLDHPNPTSYVFEKPAAEVHEQAKAALKTLGAVDMAFGKRPYRDPLVDAEAVQFAADFVVEETGNAYSSGRELLSRPGNQDDLYVHTWSDPLWPSPVYVGRGTALPFVADFHVHLAAAGPTRTVVSVAAVNTRIVNGMTWGIGSCGPGYMWRPEPVAPTTVEEYTLLRFLGRAMHVEGMPEVAVPSSFAAASSKGNGRPR
jgi:hypothetical protein